MSLIDVDDNTILVAFDVNKATKLLKEELKLAEQEKHRCLIESKLQFDEAKGYARGISCAIDIVKDSIVNDTYIMPDVLVPADESYTVDKLLEEFEKLNE